MSEQLTDRDIMDVLRETGEENYMRGYKDGYQQGRIVGFDEGIKKGIREMRRGVE